jgi:hypothetical protein
MAYGISHGLWETAEVERKDHSCTFKAANSPQNNCKRIVGALLLAIALTMLSSSASADALPFQVSNPKNKKWSQQEAGRIYESACTLVARTVRPERPPHLHPNFLLVLGASDNEVIRTTPIAEVHLKAWDADKFAEAVVIMAAREVLHADDVTSIARQSVSSAHATTSQAADAVTYPYQHFSF